MKSSFPKCYKSIWIVFMKITFFYLDPYILLIFNLSFRMVCCLSLNMWLMISLTMIVKWNNNIVDYKFWVFFFFTLQIHPFYKKIVGLCLKKKKKKENMQHMTSGTHTINWSHQPCVDIPQWVLTRHRSDNLSDWLIQAIKSVIRV